MSRHTIYTLILGCLVSLATFLPSRGATQRLETLHYDVYYHWGFIWKRAGSGILSLDKETQQDGTQQLHGRLAARSLSIVETLMKVRDTLECRLTSDYVPLSYVKRTHEGSYQAVERNTYHPQYNSTVSHTPEHVNRTLVDIHRWRSKKGSDEAHLEAIGPAYDMLSIFYVLRRLDFAHWAVGTQREYDIYSGIKSTPMYLEYRGREDCQLRNGKTYHAYRLELYFKSKDSDHTPLQVWLSTDSDQRPLKVIISLSRIGAIQGEWVEQ
jgi:hypothetical protein